MASTAAYETIREDFAALRGELYEFRHTLHRHPEPSGKEVQTAQRIREELDKAGLLEIKPTVI